MRLIRLEVSGFKGVAKADLRFGDINVVAGSNGSGKSSVIDSLAVALSGSAALPDVPVKVGEKAAEIVATLEGGLTVRRRVTPDRKMSLTVERADGSRPPKPQEFLDGLCGSGLAFDPLAFIESKPKEQADTLRKMVKLDTTDLDVLHLAIYTERTLVGRQRDAAKGHAESLPAHADVGDSERSSADVLEQMGEANRAERQRDMLLAKAERLANQAAGEQGELNVLQGQLDALPADYEAELVSLNADMDNQEAEIRQAIQALQTKLLGLERKRHEDATAIATKSAEREAALRARIAECTANMQQFKADADAVVTEANSIVIPDVQVLQAQLADLDSYNRKVADNRRKADAQAAADGLAEQYRAMTAKLESLADQKAARVAAVKWPVDGLGFGDDGTVTFRGVPLAQASQAERLRTAMAIGLAMTGTVKIVLLREASLLDDESRKMVCDLATAAGAQIVLEIVGAPTDDVGNLFLMVDGEVAYASAQE